MKWSARESVTDIGQKSLEQTTDMRQARKDAHSVRFLSIERENTVHAVDMF